MSMAWPRTCVWFFDSFWTPWTRRMWRVDAESTDGMESVCEARRTENWTSHRRIVISRVVTAARSKCEDVRASRETGSLEAEEMKENPVR